MPSEVELKLELTASGAEALRASGLLGEDVSETALRAVYFDTPGHGLHSEGLSLRIRRNGTMPVQTIKSSDTAAGLFSRDEWELPVTDSKPVADDRTPVPKLLGSRFDELVPVFEVPVLRQSCRLRSGEAEIEVAIHRGQVVAGERMAPFCEVELELVGGGPCGALFELARRIEAVAPVRISVLSKAERGYRLLGPLPEACRAEKLAIAPEMDLPTAFAAIARSCLRQYRMNEALLLERRDTEAVHQARIALRRLRSAMSLFRDMLPGPQRDRLNSRLRDLAAALGEARDLDVLSAGAEPGPVLDRLTEARDKAYAVLKRKLNAKETRRLLLDLAEWLADGAWRRDPETRALRETPLREFAGAALDRLRRKTAKHGKHLAELEDEARHQLRKDAKRLRYAVEFLAGLFDGRASKRRRKKFAKALQRLQDGLGGLNDLATAEQRLASLDLTGTPEARQFLSGWEEEDLLQEAAKARHELLDVKPFWR